jgi:hypothetical protein
MSKTTDWVIREQEQADFNPAPDDSDYDAPVQKVAVDVSGIDLATFDPFQAASETVEAIIASPEFAEWQAEEEARAEAEAQERAAEMQAALDEWPPSDPAEMAALDAWVSDREREAMERIGNDCYHPEA